VAGTITLTVDGGTALTPLSLSIDAGGLTIAGQTIGTALEGDLSLSIDAGTLTLAGQGVGALAGSDWPDATNTGVPSGTSLTSSGGITTSSNNQSFDALDISGNIQVNHTGVTFTRCRVRGGIYNIINVADGKDATFTDCEIDGQSSGTEITWSASFIRCNIHHISGIVAGVNGTYRDNWVHDIYSPGADPHTECFRMQGGQSGNLIEHNTLDMSNSAGGTAVVFINAYWGAISDNVFNNNRMIGGSSEYGYTVYSTSDPNGYSTTGTEFTNNYMQAGFGGYVYEAGSPWFTAILVWSNNRDYITDATIAEPDYVVNQ
jgi:hypothetical protein